MEKVFEIQRQARDNAKVLQSYMTDLQNWEVEMKRKEAALNGEFEQDLPPVRSKIKKDKPVKVPKKQQNRISSSDYQSWEKFDVDKACEEIDMEDVGPVSLDSKKSIAAKQEKLKEEALFEKERGNAFVKQQKWDEAISCYNRAIELVKNDAVYYANRGLCYLKKESLHQAESDCTESLRLDPSYVKALQRRATARERLGSLKAAAQDLMEVLKLEPQNGAAKRQLDAIRARMGTKGTKSKSSPSNTPTMESKSFVQSKADRKGKVHLRLSDEQKREDKAISELEQWRSGVGENITVIKPVKKPPHLRSKRPLKTIEIKEIQLGKTAPEPRPNQITASKTNIKAQGDTNNNSSRITKVLETNKGQGDCKVTEPEKETTTIEAKSPEKATKPTNDNVPEKATSPESEKLSKELIMEKNVNSLVAPVNSVQFMAEWKYLKGRQEARCRYLRLIEPSKIPSLFDNALESDVLSELLHILHDNITQFYDVTAYLRAFSSVKRFSALAMFLSTEDKLLLKKLLDYCKEKEKCSDEVITDLMNKYEL